MSARRLRHASAAGPATAGSTSLDTQALRTRSPHAALSARSAVETGSGTAITRAQLCDGEGWQLEGDIAITRSEDVLSRMLIEKRPVILCLGYAGWGPGQLDAEIEAGGWLYTDATADLIFNSKDEKSYERALQTLGLNASTVWMAPISE